VVCLEAANQPQVYVGGTRSLGSAVITPEAQPDKAVLRIILNGGASLDEDDLDGLEIRIVGAGECTTADTLFDGGWAFSVFSDDRECCPTGTASTEHAQYA
jgi:hypothetical protein